MFDTDKGSNIDLDVAFAYAWSSKIYSKSAEEDRFAASARKEPRPERKRKKYAKLALSSGDTTSPTLVPLVFEHFGISSKNQKYI